MITVETATVYRGGRRRYLTLEAAARAEARAAWNARRRASGDDYDPEWMAPRIARTARFIMAAARREIAAARGKEPRS